jgi:HEPN domain-containing protein
MAETFLKQYEVLFQKAKADIAIAFHAIDAHDPDIDNATILFHFQQAVEKLLKALLSFKKIHFEKIHDIASLIDLCKIHGIELTEYTGNFPDFNIFAVIGRYNIIDDTEGIPKQYCEQVVEFKNYIEHMISATK